MKKREKTFNPLHEITQFSLNDEQCHSNFFQRGMYHYRSKDKMISDFKEKEEEFTVDHDTQTT